MTEENFENLVERALRDLPQEIFEKTENVEITIEIRPTQEQLKKGGIRAGGLLLGLYEGVPQAKWGRGFGNVFPDKITLFQEPIEILAHSEAEILDILKNTIFHEIGHHLGFDEKGVRELERKRRLKNKGNR